MTRTYEVMFIMKPVIENTDEKIAMVETVITNNNGIVKKSDYWGKKALAYEMSGFREGLYVLIEYKADSNCTKELDRKLKIDEDILRHMIIRKCD